MRVKLNIHTTATVDPGLGGTGVAFWKQLTNHTPHPCAPYDTQALRSGSPPGAQWFTRAESITDRFRQLILRHMPGQVILEGQAIWDSTSTANACARSGDVLKLATLTGMLVQAARHAGAKAYLIQPGTWKGQLPKSAIHSRIRRSLGYEYPEHVADAVGIGLFLQGAI